MGEFEDFIKAKYPVDYESLKEKYPNVPIVEFYGDEQDEPYRVCRRVNILRDYPADKIKIYP